MTERRTSGGEDENFGDIEEAPDLSEHVLRQSLHVAFHDNDNDIIWIN